MAKRIRKPKSLVDQLNQLTPEQAVRLIQIVDPLSPEEEAEFAAMSDDDLLDALKAEG